MKVNITEKKENKLLHRVEVTGTISFDGPTPSRSDVNKAVVAATKGKFVVVKKIDTHYGGNTAGLSAFIYDDQAVFEKVEREYMRTRNVLKEEPKPEPAEEKPAEAPAEAAPEGDAPAEEAKPDAPAEKPAEEVAAPAEAPEEPKEEKKEEGE